MLQAAIARGESAGEPVAAVAVASARRERKVEVVRGCGRESAARDGVNGGRGGFAAPEPPVPRTMDALFQRFAGRGNAEGTFGERPQNAQHVWRALLRAQGIGRRVSLCGCACLSRRV